MRITSRRSIRVLPLLAALISAITFTAAVPPAVADEGAVATKESESVIKKRVAARLSVIRDLKADGKIGETWKGTVAELNDVDVDAKVEVTEKDAKGKSKTVKKTIRAILTAENDDRNALYAILAERRSTKDQVVTAEYVAKQSAKELSRRADPGDWYLLESGKWVQKPKRP